MPWPKEACVGPICIGKGINLPYIGFAVDGRSASERREMRLGLDLHGGTRLVLEADVSQHPDVDLNDALE